MLHFYANFLANIIISKYFPNSNCLLILRNNQNNFTYSGQIPAIQFSEIDQSIFGNYFGCQGIVIQTDNPANDLVRFEKLIRFNHVRFNQRKFLLIPSTTKENFSEMFSLNELNFINDFLVISPTKGGEVFDLITHKYVGVSGNNQQVLLDRWFAGNRTFHYNNDLFPNKLSNQLGRELKIATFVYPPYSVYVNDREFYGSELKAGIEFALRHNMTPKVILNYQDYWGEVYPNMTGTGLMGNLVTDKADIGFAALYTWEDSYYCLDLSKPIVRTGVSCIVPAPKLAAGWLTPLLSFSFDLWRIIGTTFVVVTAISFMFSYFYNRNEIMRKSYANNHRLNFWDLLNSATVSTSKLFIIQPLKNSEIPIETNRRLLMLFILLFSLFLSSTYSSGLASIMTIPRYEDPIETVEDFANSDLYWGAQQEAWITSIQKVEEPMYMTVVRKFITADDDELKKHLESGKFSLSIERLPRDNYAILPIIKKDLIDKFRVLKEDFYWEQCVFMARKNSVLLPTIDAFLMRTFETGLIWYWQNQAVLLFMDTYVQRTIQYYHSKHEEERPVVKLKWTHVEGAFGILLVGYGFSLIILFIELLHFRLSANKEKINFLD